MFMKSILYSVLSLISVVGVAQSQIGPGGVGTSGDVGLWFDASSLTLSDGDLVSNWGDISGNGGDANQGTFSRQPTFRSSSATMNGRPYVDFDGDDYLETGAVGALDTDVLSWYTVAKTTGAIGSGEKRAVFASRTSFSQAHYGHFFNKNQFTNHTRKSTGALVQNLSPGVMTQVQMQQPYIFGNIWRASDNLDSYMNGNNYASATGANSTGFTHTFSRIGAYAYTAASLFFKGEISEIFVFNIELNAAQNIIVHNYMSSKYGISCGSMDLYSHDATYFHEVAGIGQVDVSNNHLSAKGSGIVEVTSVGLTDGEYLFWGHDNGGLVPTTTGAPVGYVATNGEIFPQVWRVEETNTVGDLTITVDFTGIEIGDPTTYEMIIDSDADFTDAVTRIVGVYASGIVSFTVSEAQLTDGDFFTFGNTNPGIVSVVDGQNWNQPSTWSCNCIPLSSQSVTIADGHTVTVDDAQETKGLKILSTGTLVLDNGGMLDVYGDFSNEGTLDGTGLGTISFKGFSSQSITSTGTTEFGHITVDNSNGVTISTGDFSIYGVLTLKDGVFDLGNRSFTFESSATGTAALGVITSGSLINQGGVVAERFIGASVAGFRDIGTPFTSMELTQWDDELYMTGNSFPDGCVDPSNCYHSVTYWDASTQRYKVITRPDTAILSGTGIEMYMADNLNVFNAHTLASNAALNTSTSVSIPIQNGWNLISNPFMCPIDFDDVIRNDATGTGNYFYVYDGEEFEYWNGADGNPINQEASDPSLSGGIISAYQGFWVFHSGVATTITINQSSKSIGATDAYLKEGGEVDDFDGVEITLVNNLTQNKGFARLTFENQNSMNNLLTLPNVTNKDVMIASYSSEGERVTLNRLVSGEDCYAIKLNIDVLEAGDYIFGIDGIEDFESVQLINIITGDSYLLSKQNTVELFLDNTNSSDDYLLVFSKSAKCDEVELQNDNVNYSVFNNENGFTVNVDEVIEDYIVLVYNVSGQQVYTSGLTSGEVSVNNFEVQLNTGIYMVQVVGHDSGINLFTQKLFILNK